MKSGASPMFLQGLFVAAFLASTGHCAPVGEVTFNGYTTVGPEAKIGQTNGNGPRYLMRGFYNKVDPSVVKNAMLEPDLYPASKLEKLRTRLEEQYNEGKGGIDHESYQDRHQTIKAIKEAHNILSQPNGALLTNEGHLAFHRDMKVEDAIKILNEKGAPKFEMKGGSDMWHVVRPKSNEIQHPVKQHEAAHPNLHH